ADFAASLEEMLTRLRASSGPFSAVSRKLLGFIRTLGQPGRLLTLAVGVARTLCRAADAADLLARATLEAGLEGPAGAVACTVVTAVFGWLLGQLLQRLAHKDAGVGHRLSEQLQALSPGPVLREESADEREVPASDEGGPAAVLVQGLHSFAQAQQVSMPTPAHLPQSLGPPLSGLAAIRRRNRDATPPQRRPVRVQKVLEEVVDVLDEGDYVQRSFWEDPRSERAVRVKRFWDAVEQSPEG
ncbi:unnamed protein product, partial [Polarella glacialis]